MDNGMSSDIFLAHYGVKGMRWGVRRTEKQLARIRKKLPELEKRSEELDAKIKQTKKQKPSVDRDIEVRRLSDLKVRADDKRDNAKVGLSSAKVQRDYNKLQRTNMDSALSGARFTAGAAKKVAERRRKSDPDFDIHSYNKLSSSDRAKYDRAIRRGAYARTAGVGAAQVAAVLGAAYGLNKYSNLTGPNKQILNAGAGFLALNMGIQTVRATNDVRNYNRLERLRSRVRDDKGNLRIE